MGSEGGGGWRRTGWISEGGGVITACWEEAWLWGVGGDNTVEAAQYLQHQSFKTDVSSVLANYRRVIAHKLLIVVETFTQFSECFTELRKALKWH